MAVHHVLRQTLNTPTRNVSQGTLHTSAHTTSRALQASSEARHKWPFVAFILFAKSLFARCCMNNVLSLPGPGTTNLSGYLSIRHGFVGLRVAKQHRSIDGKRETFAVALGNEIDKEARPCFMFRFFRVELRMQVPVANPWRRSQQQAKGKLRAIPAFSAKRHKTARKKRSRLARSKSVFQASLNGVGKSMALTSTMLP